MGKTRDLLKKIRDTKGTCHAKMGTIKVAGKWINSQRIDREGNGHWDNDAEKTAFAVLLLNEM